jgi:PAS domain S-box-containing protein
LENQKSPGNNSFAKLRAEAEKALNASGAPGRTVNGKDINVLFQELQVHQIELEMQNDELRIINEEMMYQQLKFEGIYNLAPVGYFIMDNTGIIKEVNNAGISLLDSTKSVIISRSLQAYIAPGYEDYYYLFISQMQRSNNRQSCQLQLISKTGRNFFAQVVGIAINNYAGHRQCYVAIIDITERIEAESSLAQTKERLELALEASATGTWELDLNTLQFYFDEFIYRICNISLNIFNGDYQSFINHIHEDDRHLTDQHFRTAINGNKEVDMISRFVNTEGATCHISIRGHVAEAGNKRRLVGIMTDVTEKRRLEEEAMQLKLTQQKQIATASLNAEENERRRISESLHDSVSQLLYGIKMQIDQVGSPASTDSFTQIKKLLNTAIQETRNISFELAPSILTDFGLPSTIDELVNRLSSPLFKINATVTGFSQRCELLLETSIFRIVQELINNAMKHSGADSIQLSIKKNKIIEIRVEDNGKGFNVKKQETLPTGSGFSSIKTRIGLFNGSMRIDSAPDRGTKIKIRLEPGLK